MRIDEMKKGFWGYKKESVFQYIAEQEETYSHRLQEQTASAEQQLQQYRKRVDELEEELRRMQAELSQARKHQDMISDALLEAQACAERMKAETRSQELEAREKIQETLRAEMAALEQYQGKITELRNFLQEMLQVFQQAAADASQKAEQLASDSPAENLTLFQKAQEQEDAM